MAENGDAAALKRLLVKNGQGFTLEDAWDKTKTYKIMFYNTTLALGQHRRWKVDILVPGDANIPFVSKKKFRYLSITLTTATFTLPCIPLAPLLLLKLQSWHIDRNDKQRKDLVKLLYLAIHSGVKGSSFRSLPPEFVTAARIQALDFTGIYTGTYEEWAKIGIFEGVYSKPVCVHRVYTLFYAALTDRNLQD